MGRNLLDSLGFVLPRKSFESATTGKLMAANRQRLEGGEKEAVIILVISGLGQKSGQKLDLRIPTWVYEADIHEDIILSYEWFRLRGVDISARQHGLLCFKRGHKIWIDGAQALQLTHPEALVRVFEDDKGLAQNKKVALDLCSGTGSVAKVLEGWVMKSSRWILDQSGIPRCVWTSCHGTTVNYRRGFSTSLRLVPLAQNSVWLKPLDTVI